MYKTKNRAIIIVAFVVILILSIVMYDVYSDSLTSNSEDYVQTVSVAGGTAADFTMTDETGQEVKLSDFEDAPVVLHFWTSWCNFCIDELPYFQSAFHEYGEEIQFLMVNAVASERESEDGKNFINESEYTFPVYYEMNGEAKTLYGLCGFPATVFIDKDGKIIQMKLSEMSEEELYSNLDRLLKDE